MISDAPPDPNKRCYDETSPLLPAEYIDVSCSIHQRFEINGKFVPALLPKM
jgi:hypothetical protein